MIRKLCSLRTLLCTNVLCTHLDTPFYLIESRYGARGFMFTIGEFNTTIRDSSKWTSTYQQRVHGCCRDVTTFRRTHSSRVGRSTRQRYYKHLCYADIVLIKLFQSVTIFVLRVTCLLKRKIWKNIL